MAMLPLTVIMLALSARSAALASRIGPRLQMTVGPLLIAAGMVLFTRVHGSGDYLTQVLPAVLVLGLGLATNVAPLTATALSAAPAEHSGIASAVNNDVARTASLIAVAVLPALAGITGDVYLHPAALTQGLPHRHADRRGGGGGRRRPRRRDHQQPAAAAGRAAGGRRGRGALNCRTAPSTRRRCGPAHDQGGPWRRVAGASARSADSCSSPGLPAAGDNLSRGRRHGPRRDGS